MIGSPFGPLTLGNVQLVVDLGAGGNDWFGRALMLVSTGSAPTRGPVPVVVTDGAAFASGPGSTRAADDAARIRHKSPPRAGGDAPFASVDPSESAQDHQAPSFLQIASEYKGGRKKVKGQEDFRWSPLPELRHRLLTGSSGQVEPQGLTRELRHRDRSRLPRRIPHRSGFGSALQISDAMRTIRSDIDPFRRAGAKSDIKKDSVQTRRYESAIALL